MIRVQYRRLSFVFLAAPLLMTPGVLNAQQPRTRTFVYDPDRKEWTEQPPPPPGTAAGDLHAIRVQIKEANYRQSLSAAGKWVKRYGQTDPLHPEVLLARAEALVGRREHYKAHTILQEFLSRFAGMPLASEALRLEFVIAETFLSGVKRKVWGIPLLSGEDLAYRILDEISTDYPDSRLAELAIKAKADHLFKVGEHAFAELEYARFLRDYPQSRYHQVALRRSAEAVLARFAGVEYDGAALIEAQEAYEDYRLRYPLAADREEAGLILDGIKEMRAEKGFSIGAYYERTNHPGSAVFYYQQVRDKWPDTIAAVKAASRLELLGATEPVTSADAPRRTVRTAEAKEASNR